MLSCHVERANRAKHWKILSTPLVVGGAGGTRDVVVVLLLSPLPK